MITVYISIGNSDDKLTQVEWASFYRETCLAIRDHAVTVHGQWVSEPVSAWQNACWCIEIDDDEAGFLRGELSEAVTRFRQDSIAWATTTKTEFIKG